MNHFTGTSCVVTKQREYAFLPGRAGILSATGGATASEMLTVTMVTKLVVGSRVSEHMKVSTASQTTGFSDAGELPSR